MGPGASPGAVSRSSTRGTGPIDWAMVARTPGPAGAKPPVAADPPVEVRDSAAPIRHCWQRRAAIRTLAFLAHTDVLPISRRLFVPGLYPSEREIPPEVTQFRASSSSQGGEQRPDLCFDVGRVGHRAGDLLAEDLAVAL